MKKLYADDWKEIAIIFNIFNTDGRQVDHNSIKGYPNTVRDIMNALKRAVKVCRNAETIERYNDYIKALK